VFKRVFLRDVPVFNKALNSEGIWAMEILLHAYVTSAQVRAVIRLTVRQLCPKGNS